MRYGILSDAHGNLEALENVLAHLEQQRVDQLVFLGDAVGYGANPNEVCDLLRQRAGVAILGNHDAAVSQRIDYADYYQAARDALDWTTKQMSEENLAWLRSLPFKRRVDGIEFSHGSPVHPEAFDYLFAPEQVVDLEAAFGDLAPVTFIGHSHLTLAFRITDGEVEQVLADAIDCESSVKHIITAGSVGQPRDRDPRACCGIYDSATCRFEFHRVEYDIATARQKILDAGLSPVFGERLLVGM